MLIYKNKLPMIDAREAAETVAEHILIIDDDEKLAAMLTEYLETRGMQVTAAFDAASGMETLLRENCDALILDVMLPDLDGFEVCKKIRTRSEIPILMLTARGDADDLIVGLEIGADDYLPKPFNPRELLARLRAIMRRNRPAASEAAGKLLFGELEIDRDARVVRLKDRDCGLTGFQFNLLLTLAENAGRVMSRDALMDQLKGELYETFDRSIDVHISRLRAAIEEDPKKPKRILTMRGVGYMFSRTDRYSGR